MSLRSARSKIKEAKKNNPSVLNLNSQELTNEDLIKLMPEIKSLEWKTSEYIDAFSYIPTGSNRLTSLDLNYNYLTNVDILKNLTNLTSLYLGGNNLSNLDSIKDLINLTTLNSAANDLINVDFLKNLTHLTFLNLSGNNLKTCDSIKNLTKLTSLHLSNNDLSTVDFLKDLTNLTSLDLNYNNLTNVDILRNLTNLTSLDLGYNQLSNVDFLKELTNLTLLNLNRNKLKNINFLKYLTNLTILDLRYNNLTSVNCLLELKNLTSLYLNERKKTDYSFIEELKKLPDLIFNYDKLLDEEISYNSYDISGNPLGELALYFGIEKSIYQTYKNTPEKLWQLIEAKANKSNELKALLECRVVLIGQGNAGKTSLRQRLLGSDFEDKGKTEGVEIEGMDLVVREQNVRVNIWDFGGQEVYHSTHKFFFRARCLYILVVDVRAGMEKFIVKYWLRQIKELAKSNAPLIIVANKAEINDETTNNKVIDENYKAKFETLLEEFKAIYPNIKNVHYVSTNTPLNTDEVKQELVKAIDKDLPEVFTTYPAYFAETRERFKADKDGSSKFGDFISKQEFENQLSDEAKKDDKVVEILDVLGVFCHFKKNEDDNDDELEKMYVLNPEWITKGVYKILSSYILAEKKGKVTYADIKTILNKSVYEGKHNYIIKLMRRFKLCFVKNYQDKDFVIFPTWLPITETAYSPFIADISRFEYKYESETELEKAITNFIVDAQSNSNDDQDTYWRRGIVIRNNQLRSLVKADLETETLAITIEGEQTERNKKLNEIKSYFAKFHRENEVKVQEVEFNEIGKVKDVIAKSDSPDKYLLDQIPKLEEEIVNLQAENKTLKTDLVTVCDIEAEKSVNKFVKTLVIVTSLIHVISFGLLIKAIFSYEQGWNDFEKWTFVVFGILEVFNVIWSVIYFLKTSNDFSWGAFRETLLDRKKNQKYIDYNISALNSK